MTRPITLADPPVAGRYLLLERVGVGAMGTVYAASDLREGREVAVKLLRRSAQAHGEVLLRFVREQSLRIDHPHVLAPHGWAADDDHVLLVMDLVRGGSLETLLRAGRLPETYVAALLAQLLAGLGAVHAAGVVHRDIKPGNLLLEPTGRRRPHLRLGDFGVAAVLGDELRLTRVPGGVGTDGFIAPECATGAAPEPRQDLWAAGRVARRALGSDLSSGPDAAPSTGLEPVLRALLQDDPDDRPADAATARALLGVSVDLDAPWEESGMPDVADLLGPLTPGPSQGGSRTLRRLSSACLSGSVALSAVASGASVAGRWP